MTSRLKAELRPEQLLPSLSAGLVNGALAIVISISFGALIFSGPLSGQLSVGVGVALVAAMLLGAIAALRSSLSSLIATPQDSVAAILALMAASIGHQLSDLGPAQLLPTILAAIAITTTATGISLLALGLAGLGRLIRFIPYPVVGGFLAGTGWLLVRGSFGVLADVPLDFEQVPLLLSGEALPRWLSGVIFALVLLVVMRRFKRLLAMPLTLLSAFGLFYLALLVSNTPLLLARQQGWLLDPGAQAGLWPGLALLDASQIQWGAVLEQIGNIGAVVVFSAVSLLLNATAIELETRQDVDLDRELQAAGLANLAGGMAGGMPGFHALSLTVLGHRLGARGHLPGLVVAALCALALLFGPSLIGYFPRPLLGGLLLFLGIYFLVEWVYDAWFKLPRIDYVLVLIILLVVAAWGFLQGVGVGLLIAIVLFVIKYSHVGVVKHALSGATYWSNVDRPTEHLALLQQKGGQQQILKLQSYLFFGTANNLLQEIRARVTDTSRTSVRFVVLDFRRVSGIDSSATFTFSKLRQLSETYGFTLAFASLPPSIRAQLRAVGYVEEQGAHYRIFASLDHAVEWCENQILAAEGAAGERTISLLQQLDHSLGSGVGSVVAGYLDRIAVDAGAYLMRQGDSADDLYFLERGSLTVLLDVSDGQQLRLRRIRSGSIVGEVGLYLGTARTASVLADEDSVLYRLTRESLAAMTHEHPAVAARFHESVAKMLADRLVKLNKVLEALLD